MLTLRVMWIRIFDATIYIYIYIYIFISVINQLDEQHFCFTISLLHASAFFEHMCPASGIITPTGVMIPEAV